MFPILQIGPAAIRTPELLLLAGLYLGLVLAERSARRRGENADVLTNLVLLAGVAGLVSARVFYALGHLGLFRNNLAGLFSIDASLLDPWGGITGALITSLIYGQRKRIKFWAALDGLAPFLAVLFVFIGLANIASGQAFGSLTSLSWGIELWGAKRHPSQIYETLGAIAILFLLWKQFGSAIGSGKLFLRFASMVSGLFVFLSAFHGNSRLVLGIFRQEQLLALIIMGLVLFVLEVKLSSEKGKE
jgi:phosphatidylglycerol---prolipoprotein diacylglyceryl transferase